VSSFVVVYAIFMQYSGDFRFYLLTHDCCFYYRAAVEPTRRATTINTSTTTAAARAKAGSDVVHNAPIHNKRDNVSARSRTAATLTPKPLGCSTRHCLLNLLLKSVVFEHCFCFESFFF